MRRSVIGTEAVTAIVRVIGDTDIIVPITDPTMATTVIADPTTVMAMAIGPTGVQVSACGSASRLRNAHLNRRLIRTSGAAVRFSLSLRAATMSFGIPHKQRTLRAVSTRSALEDRRMNLLRSSVVFSAVGARRKKLTRPEIPCGLNNLPSRPRPKGSRFREDRQRTDEPHGRRWRH